MFASTPGEDRQILEHLPAGLMVLDTEGKLLTLNSHTRHLLGLRENEEATGRPLETWVAASHRPAFREWFQRALAGASAALMYPLTGDNLAVRWLETHARPLRDGRGQVTSLVALSQDITQRRQVEESLRLREERWRTTLQSIGDAVIVTDAAGRIEQLNPEAERLTGWPLGDARGRPLEEVFRIVNEETRHPVENPVTRVLRQGVVVGLANHTLLLARDGREIPVADSGAPIRDDAGRLAGVVLVFRDQTAERTAQRAVAEARALADGIVATIREPLLVLDAELRVVSANRSFYQTFQVTPEQTVGRRVYELGHRQWDIPELRELLEQILPQNTQFDEFEVTHEFERIGRRTMLLNARRLYGEAGKTRMILLALEDITEQKQAEAALRASEERNRFINALISDYAYAFRVEPDGTLHGEWVSDSFVRVFGFTIPEIEARGGWQIMVFPEDRPAALAHARKVAGGAKDICEMRFVSRSGEVRWLRDYAAPVWDAAQQRVVRIYGAAQDITERHRLEAQLRQAQKMEAIGRLAGGVAHDFNNILAAVLLQSELLERAAPTPPLREGLRQIRAAAERAANLTRQLLLFSRQQVLQPRDLDLNQVVEDLLKMLRRIIGEDIKLEWRPAPESLSLRADPGMIEQVLLNLVINARDAMPRGGRLRIQTGTCTVDEAAAHLNPEARPGRHIWLRVEDTGCGIPPEVLSHIFEPFFTTKEPGKGTGLGLATVYGVVQQHQGWITVESEVGRGTAFQIFLPLAARSAAAPASSAPTPTAVGGHECLLLVEDDATLRETTRQMLESHGYRVLAAADGLQALALWKDHGRQVALVLTDLVMPGGVSGQELVRRLRADRPELKVVYTSGYSEAWRGQEIRLQPGERFVSKPCPVARLLQTLRQCLDS